MGSPTFASTRYGAARSSSGRPSLFLAILTPTARTRTIRYSNSLANALRETPFPTLPAAMDTGQTNERHARMTLMRLIESLQEWFVVWYKGHFLDSRLAEGDRICGMRRGELFDLIFSRHVLEPEVPLESRRTN